MISFEDYKAYVAKRRSEDGENVKCHLGQPEEDIKFRVGDIVEFGKLSPKDCKFLPALGVVIAVPDTLEQRWERLKNLPDFEAVEGWGKIIGGFSSSYLVATGRFQPNLYHYEFVSDNNINIPSEPVSEEMRAKLMGWYDEAVEGRKNYILPGLGPEAEAYAARYKEIEPIAALEALAHMYVDQCGVSRSARTVAFDAAENWMRILGKSDHPLASKAMHPILDDDGTVSYYVLESFVDFIPLINDELAQHREMLERYDISYLRAEDTAYIADMLYREYDDDTTRIALCYGIKLALKEELKVDRKLRKFLGTL